MVHQPVIKPDSKRLNNVVAKHAIGLYYEVMREPLPLSYGTWCCLCQPGQDPARGSLSLGTNHCRCVGRLCTLRWRRRRVQIRLQLAHGNHYGFAAVLLYFDNFADAVHSFARPIAEAAGH